MLVAYEDLGLKVKDIRGDDTLVGPRRRNLPFEIEGPESSQARALPAKI